MDANLINAHIEAAMQRRFAWGQNDCCTFVCDAVQEATGLDLMKPLRGLYDSEATAKAAMGGNLVECVQGLARQAALVPVEFPFEGADLGLVATGNGPALALFHEHKWVGQAQNGVVTLPARMGVLAWRLP